MDVKGLINFLRLISDLFELTSEGGWIETDGNCDSLSDLFSCNILKLYWSDWNCFQDNASFRAIAALEKQKVALETKAQKLRKERDGLATNLSDTSDRLKKIRLSRKAIEEAFKKMKEMETDENREYVTIYITWFMVTFPEL